METRPFCFMHSSIKIVNVRKCGYAIDEQNFNLKFRYDCNIYDVIFVIRQYYMNTFIVFG
jgi:hypothetical protein